MDTIQHTANNLTGQRFGRWLVLSLGRKRKQHQWWLCRCDCGVKREVNQSHLMREQSRSCGCLNHEQTSNRNTTHGLSKTVEYRIYKNIKRRCLNPHNKCFHLYGGRGITMCQGWKSSFESFLSDLGKRPSPKHTIDRKDNFQGYHCGHCEECLAHQKKANCQWATPKEQANNRRNNSFLTYKGITKTVSQWAEAIGMSQDNLWQRIAVYGWPVERAIETPIKHR